MSPTEACRRLVAGLIILLALSPGAIDALVIYRFGGEQLGPPPEADSAGVSFVQMAWSDQDTDAGGNVFDVDLSAGTVDALRRDPTVDIAPTIEETGGIYERADINAQIWDGDPTTVWNAKRYLCAEFDEKNYFLSCTDDFGTPGTANITLGGLYQLDRIRLISGLDDPAKTVQAVRVYMALEMPFTTVYQHPRAFEGWLVEVRDNREQILDIPIPPHEDIAFVQIALGEHDTEWDVHDVQLFAKGFVGRSTYTSNIIDFGRRMAWGEMRWGGVKGDRAKVSVQSRSGDDGDPDLYWRYTGRGEDRAEVRLAEYDKLKLGEKAGTSYDQDHWSFWSTYAFDDSVGTQIVSPSPRQFVQFQVDILPKEEDGGEVRFLEFRASEPLASELVAEVWPATARLGELTQFTYVLRPTIGVEDFGFDRIEIQSLSLLRQLRDVRVGDEPVAYRVEASEDHRLVVRVPHMEAKDSGALIQIDFEAQILRFGSSFDGRVTDTSRPLEVPQSVQAGDATGEFEGNTTSVETAAEDEGQLLQVRVVQPVATPNGDGVNDVSIVSYEIFEITGTASVQVEVCDLSGHRVRLLHDGADALGTYERPWDGLNDDGMLMPPGIYPYSVSVDTDRERIRKVGLLYVAY
jgi:hypothetical protein